MSSSPTVPLSPNRKALHNNHDLPLSNDHEVIWFFAV